MANKGKQKIPQQQLLKGKKSKIPIQAITLKEIPEIDSRVTFSFKNTCDNHCLLSEWTQRELNDLMKTFKTIESLSWNEIRVHPGLQCKHVDQAECSKPIPSGVPLDVRFLEMRVNDRSRLFAYRTFNICNVVWFDRNHEVLPYHKQRA
jgi:hypothetical protein